MRYEPVTDEVYVAGEAVIMGFFPDLVAASILYVFDTKKRVSEGKIVVAKIKKMNEEMKFMAMNDDGVTYDYVVFIDKNVWDVLDETDRKRILFHEFCHCTVDFEKKNPYNLRGHEIEGFYDEQNYNHDDPRWSERVSTVAESVYDPENE